MKWDRERMYSYQLENTVILHSRTITMSYLVFMALYLNTNDTYLYLLYKKRNHVKKVSQ